MATSTKSLTAENDAPAPLRFERRTCDRWPAEVVGTCFQLGGDNFGHMNQIKVVDYSDGGCGALCEEPIKPGSIVSVGFSAPGLYAKRGTVVRCEPRGEGYRLAIEFEARLAA